MTPNHVQIATMVSTINKTRVKLK